MILMWARGMSEFGAVIIIAYNPKTAPVLIYERFTSYGLQSSIIAATVFISITLIVFVILRMVKK
jgi:molybdate/tungstate transport system permease protein